MVEAPTVHVHANSQSITANNHFLRLWEVITFLQGYWTAHKKSGWSRLSENWVACTLVPRGFAAHCSGHLNPSNFHARSTTQRKVTVAVYVFCQTSTSKIPAPQTSTSDIHLEDPGTHTATASFLYLLVPPLTVFHSTLEQSLSGTVCLSLSLRILI